MFVLRYKEGHVIPDYSFDDKEWRDKNVSGRYVRYMPSREEGRTTADLELAEVFNTPDEAARNWEFPNCEIVKVSITLTEEVK